MTKCTYQRVLKVKGQIIKPSKLLFFTQCHIEMKYRYQFATLLYEIILSQNLLNISVMTYTGTVKFSKQNSCLVSKQMSLGSGHYLRQGGGRWNSENRSH